ncbi:MAG: Gfo/Idh/MocA family oxidoreductase [Armatimonadetes bacterium]|nr:Gfo/Idh/MocA family oxidoreductase [Armatimonadota bacterium]
MAKVKPIKAAVVGLGRAGWNIHVHRMRGRPEFQITAVADSERSRREEARRELQCETYEDYESLLRSAEAELVVVATNSSTHTPITIAALKSGRHVLVEKPMATRVADAKRMVRTAETTGKKLLVHQNYRFHPYTRHLMDVIQDKTIGNVFEIRCRVLTFARRNDWQTLRKYGGGVLNNTGVHFVDATMQMLESPVKEVFCDLKLVSDSGDTEDQVKLLLRGENGRVVDIEISTSCAFPEPPWTLLGTRGTLTCDNKTSKIRRFDLGKVKRLEVDERPPATRQYGNAEVLPWEDLEVPALGRQTSDYYDNVWGVLRKGKPQEVTLESVIEVMKVIERAREQGSFASWRPAKWS